MWYHLQCLPSLLRDGARKSITVATSCARRVYAAISDPEVVVEFLLAGVLLCNILLLAVFTIDIILRIR